MKAKYLFLIALFSILVLGCGGGESATGQVGDSDDPIHADGDEPKQADGDEPPISDGDETEATDGDSDEPLPDEMGCEVDAASIDGGELVDFVAEDITHDREVFSVLVQSGSMTKDAAIVWTYVEDNQPKRLRIWRETPEAGQIALVFDDTVTPTDGFIKERIGGLAPKTEYHYAFFTMEGDTPQSRSMIGRFKTAFPEGCLAPIVIGGTHGTNFNKQPFKALEITSTYDLDMFIHLGDYSYNDSAVLADGRFREEVKIEDYRALWRRTLDDEGFRRLLSATGQYIVRDDHEVCDNSCLEAEKFREDILHTGLNSFLENTPVEASDGYKFWRSYRWGDTAEIFVLDCRTERKPETRESEQAVYIGQAQMDWLKEELASSEAHFKIILNSVPITLFDHHIWLMQHDRWQGYQAQREEILSHIIDAGVENVWWLTGDFHLGSVNRIQSSGAYASMWEIMMGPGGNDGNPIWPMVNGQMELFPPEEVVPPEQFDFFYGEKATTIVTFDPIRDNVHIRFFDAETGEVLYDKKLQWIPYTEGGDGK